MKMLSEVAEITFDDVLLLPNHSSFPIEQEEKKISLKTKISKNLTLDIPIVSAPMPSVTEAELAIAIGKAGGIGVIHFFQSFESQLKQVARTKKEGVKVAAGVADLSKAGKDHVGNLLDAGVDLVSVEAYHAQNEQFLDFIRDLKKTYRNLELCAGYVVTKEATKELVKAGADSIRVGIGGGSHCTTRIVTGVGRPQLSAVADCYEIAKKHNVPIMSDTGIKVAGDIPKAMAFGANSVMIGGLFTGTDESPGKVFFRKGKKYKKTWGMCTDKAITQQHESQTSKLMNNIKVKLNKVSINKFFEEGVEGEVEYKGSVISIIEKLAGGTKRSMWYQGVRNLSSLRKNARVILVSQNTRLENIHRI